MENLERMNEFKLLRPKDHKRAWNQHGLNTNDMPMDYEIGHPQQESMQSSTMQ